MCRLPQSIQAQTPSNRAQTSAQRRETLPVLQMPETILPFRILQPAHEPPILLLQAVQGLGGGHRTLPDPFRRYVI